MCVTYNWIRSLSLIKEFIEHTDLGWLFILRKYHSDYDDDALQLLGCITKCASAVETLHFTSAEASCIINKACRCQRFAANLSCRRFGVTFGQFSCCCRGTFLSCLCKQPLFFSKRLKNVLQSRALSASLGLEITVGGYFIISTCLVCRTSSSFFLWLICSSGNPNTELILQYWFSSLLHCISVLKHVIYNQKSILGGWVCSKRQQNCTEEPWPAIQTGTHLSPDQSVALTRGPGQQRRRSGHPPLPEANRTLGWVWISIFCFL